MDDLERRPLPCQPWRDMILATPDDVRNDSGRARSARGSLFGVERGHRAVVRVPLRFRI